MAPETQVPTILRFGVFEADLRSGEVRKQGVRIKLQEQPFQVLKILLQRPGEVVTREQLRSEIWQSDTFVDFDNGLNTSINKLREALGDSADNPRFIETLPRRGYRWMTSAQPIVSVPANLPVLVPIRTLEVSRETSENSISSSLHQLALSQTFFFLLAALELLYLGKGMEWAPHLLIHMPLLERVEYLCNAVVAVAGSLFTGLNALEIWGGSLEAVRFFRRKFVLYVFVDVFLIQVVLYLLYEFDVLGYALVLLPVLVYLPFYQKRLAMRILTA